MEMFNKITIAHFIWYLVPGLAFELFLLFPFFVLSPPLAKAIFTNLGPVGIVLVAIVLGFILDGLRLYRLRPKYDETKSKFFSDLLIILNASGLDPYFVQSRVADLAREKNVSGIAIHHAIWIMHGHMSMLAFLESCFWALTIGYFYFWEKAPYPVLVSTYNWYKALSLFACLSLGFLLVGLRFYKISSQDQKTTNKMFLDFAKQHVVEIKNIMNIT